MVAHTYNPSICEAEVKRLKEAGLGCYSKMSITGVLVKRKN
jgi:hypothetical protein